MSNKHAIRDAFLSSQRAQDSTEMTQSDSPKEREIRNDLKSSAVRENNTEYRRGAVEDSELDEIEDEKSDKALQWLEVEWDSLAKILRQTDPDVDWEDVY